jgi:prolyl oligopeptidase
MLMKKMQRSRSMPDPVTSAIKRAAPAALVLALAAVACTTTREPALESRSVPSYSIEDFLGTTVYQGASFTADGKAILASNDSTGVLNVYAVPVDGTPPQPLTRSATESIALSAAFPHDARFLYLSDQGGNELSHLYVQEADGTAKDLTPGDKLKANFLGWASDDKSFFASTNERDPRFFDPPVPQRQGVRARPRHGRPAPGRPAPEPHRDRHRHHPVRPAGEQGAHPHHPPG